MEEEDEDEFQYRPASPSKTMTADAPAACAFNAFCRNVQLPLETNNAFAKPAVPTGTIGVQPKDEESTTESTFEFVVDKGCDSTNSMGVEEEESSGSGPPKLAGCANIVLLKL